MTLLHSPTPNKRKAELFYLSCPSVTEGCLIIISVMVDSFSLEQSRQGLAEHVADISETVEALSGLRGFV